MPKLFFSGNRTAVAPPTPPGPKGSNGNGSYRVSGSPKGASSACALSFCPRACLPASLPLFCPLSSAYRSHRTFQRQKAKTENRLRPMSFPHPGDAGLARSQARLDRPEALFSSKAGELTSGDAEEDAEEAWKAPGVMCGTSPLLETSA